MKEQENKKMREIKFRAWDKKKKMWSHWNLYCMDCSNEYPFLALIKGCYATNMFLGEEMDIEIMQYTGLKDKNGTEIYESDVVYVTSLLAENNPSFRAIVEWGVSGFVIRRISNFTDGFYMYPVFMDLNPMAFLFEVIGNIYAHPHLIDENKLNEKVKET